MFLSLSVLSEVIKLSRIVELLCHIVDRAPVEEAPNEAYFVSRQMRRFGSLLFAQKMVDWEEGDQKLHMYMS